MLQSYFTTAKMLGKENGEFGAVSYLSADILVVKGRDVTMLSATSRLENMGFFISF